VLTTASTLDANTFPSVKLIISEEPSWSDRYPQRLSQVPVWIATQAYGGWRVLNTVADVV
jgi:hypothetical protein